VLGERGRAGSLPGERSDGFRVALAIESGGMRGTISARSARLLARTALRRESPALRAIFLDREARLAADDRRLAAYQSAFPPAPASPSIPVPLPAPATPSTPVPYARYPGDPGIDSLVTEMLALSPRFADMWAEHEVEVRGPMLKHVDHPLVGPLQFECQVLHIAETGQRLIAYCAAPGSATEAAFRELAARAPLPA